jgi:hypothetical protein
METMIIMVSDLNVDNRSAELSCLVQNPSNKPNTHPVAGVNWYRCIIAARVVYAPNDII